MADESVNKINREKSIETEKEKLDISEALNKVDSSSEVADIMEGVEKNGIEDVSEKKNQKGDSQNIRKVIINKKKQQIKTIRPLPSANVMRRKVIKQMVDEEKILIKNINKAKNYCEFADRVKEVRSFRQKISDFMIKTVDFIKDMYLKYFGEKHGISEKDDDINEK